MLSSPGSAEARVPVPHLISGTFLPFGTVHAIRCMPVSKMSLPGNCMHHYYQMSNLRAGEKKERKKRSESERE